ncbi:MAG: N-formylglutamate amidohydrolase [Proteobacteria bacterium]|nr:N-formylglutamate amidohydrolase [Pseudomonadota bacterium]MDA1057513.1 N-formylglutamate amidohydrolase [Pseudomonadota bacterium]
MNYDSAAGAMDAFNVVNPSGESRLVLTCDHAGNHIPEQFGALGLSADRLVEHVAWDIGAADLTCQLAERLDAQAILATHSRLFIDPNRMLGSADSILRVSDGVEVPGNQNVTPDEAGLRAELAFWPYHHEIEKALHLTEHRKSVVAYVAVHSFTPTMAGARRPWDIGVLYGRDRRMADPLLAALGTQADICVGDNQPYSAAHPPGYGLEAYGTSAGRPHVMVEIRQDLLLTDAGIDRWATILADALAPLADNPALFTRQYYR